MDDVQLLDWQVIFYTRIMEKASILHENIEVFGLGPIVKGRILFLTPAWRADIPVRPVE